MVFKKILAGVVAGALAVGSMAVGAFAEESERAPLSDSVVGDWERGEGTYILTPDNAALADVDLSGVNKIVANIYHVQTGSGWYNGYVVFASDGSDYNNNWCQVQFFEPDSAAQSNITDSKKIIAKDGELALEVDASTYSFKENGTFTSIFVAVPGGENDNGAIMGLKSIEFYADDEYIGLLDGDGFVPPENDPNPPAGDEAETNEGSVTIKGVGWWAEGPVTIEELIGDLDPDKVTSVSFTSDVEFAVGYNSTEQVGEKENGDPDYWKQNAELVKELTLTDIDFGDNYGLTVYISKDDGVDYVISWVATTAAEEEPTEEGDLQINIETDLNINAIIITTAGTYVVNGVEVPNTNEDPEDPWYQFAPADWDGKENIPNEYADAFDGNKVTFTVKAPVARAAIANEIEMTIVLWSEEINGAIGYNVVLDTTKNNKGVLSAKITGKGDLAEEKTNDWYYLQEADVEYAKGSDSTEGDNNNGDDDNTTTGGGTVTGGTTSSTTTTTTEESKTPEETTTAADNSAPSAETTTTTTQAPAVSDNNGAGAGNDGAASGTDGNPSTGVVFAVIPALAAAAGVMISKKRK